MNHFAVNLIPSLPVHFCLKGKSPNNLLVRKTTLKRICNPIQSHLTKSRKKKFFTYKTKNILYIILSLLDIPVPHRAHNIFILNFLSVPTYSCKRSQCLKMDLTFGALNVHLAIVSWLLRPPRHTLTDKSWRSV